MGSMGMGGMNMQPGMGGSTQMSNMMGGAPGNNMMGAPGNNMMGGPMGGGNPMYGGQGMN